MMPNQYLKFVIFSLPLLALFDENVERINQLRITDLDRFESRLFYGILTIKALQLLFVMLKKEEQKKIYDEDKEFLEKWGHTTT
jgi:hypothetical protein